MEVQTFIETQEQAQFISEPEEWCKEVEALGLTGQKRFTPQPLAEGSTESIQKSVIPFPRMTPEMLLVYKTLLPDQNNVLQYAGDPIPMKALEMLRLAKNEAWFAGERDCFEVWHKFGHPDPILVAKKYNTQGADFFYLMARWGPEKESFEQAKEKAVKILCGKLLAAAQTTMDKCKALVASETMRVNQVLEHMLKGKFIDVDDLPF